MITAKTSNGSIKFYKLEKWNEICKIKSTN
jgi:hypothetical protein